MTLRLIQGNLLIVSGQLANSEDCCCPPPIPDCAGTRTVNYWQITDNPTRPLGGCCSDLVGTYFPDPALTTATSWERLIEFAEPEPCVDFCNTVITSIINEFGQEIFTTTYWNVKSIHIKTEIDDGTGFLGTTGGGLTIIAKTVIEVEFYRHTKTDGSYCVEAFAFPVVDEEVATNCPFFMTQFFRSQGPGDTGPCNPTGVSNAGMKLDTYFNVV